MKIKKQVVRGMLGHAKKEAPLEACGYLAGKEGVITNFYALTNIDKSGEHFSLEPKEQFAALRDARKKGLAICAVYHSHPASPGRPSAEDINLARDPDILYVIVSLAAGREDIRAFSIKGQQVAPVSLEVINDEGI